MTPWDRDLTAESCLLGRNALYPLGLTAGGIFRLAGEESREEKAKSSGIRNKARWVEKPSTSQNYASDGSIPSGQAIPKQNMAGQRCES